MRFQGSRRLAIPVLTFGIAALWLGALTLRAAGDQDPAKPPALSAVEGQAANADELAKQVYAIFKQNCLECHGAAREAGLDLRTEATLQKGSRRGRVIVPHKPEESRLYAAVMHTGDVAMPDGKDQLPASDLDVIKRWIEAGGSIAAVPEAKLDTDEEARLLARREERPITPEEREYWAFKIPVRPEVPTVARAGWTSNPIDAFLLAKMDAKGLKPAPAADKRALIRRVYLDMLGLPPSYEEVEAFVKDTSPDAWSKVVDKVLASPHYGERWARHWMDLVRYADSGGFEFDVDRPEMYRYRDYLIDSFNKDKPYDLFIKEQLAGDEYVAERPDKASKDEAMIATGYLRLGTEGGGRNEALDDMVATTSLTFSGMTVQCARCHNHKFDPIPQKDYYRMQAVFFSTRDVDYSLVPEAELAANRKETQRIDALIKPIRGKKDQLEKPYHQQIIDREIAKLPDYMQLAWKTPPEKRTEGQRLNVIQIQGTLAINSLRKLVTTADVVALMPPDVKAQHAKLEEEIEALDRQKPRRLPSARAIGERGREPQPSFFLHRGSPDSRGTQMTPGVLAVTRKSDWTFPEAPPTATSSYRRRGYAEWLVSPENPLTARVMVNRLWQHHFGEGIVRTPSNFGKMGEPPSHPELLDWLATEFVAKGWSLKAMHRQMLTSAAYQMSTVDIPANINIDPENRMFWRMPRVRLEAEIIRDTILATAGSLDRTIGGPNIFPYIDPDLFEKSSRRDWRGVPDSDPSTWRRSLYIFSKRSIRYPMFETFDQPNLVNSTERRNRTTLATQALILMNNPMVRFQAGQFAARVKKEAGPDAAKQVARAIEIALGRPADAVERKEGLAFVKAGGAEGLAQFCHVLMNLNEFVYRP
jgi:mono/diheme cytochrome c family protein